jgi:hypothetical protein
MLDIPLLLSSQVMLALCIVPVKIVILISQLLIFYLCSPEFLFDLSHTTLPSAVLLPYPKLCLPRFFIRAVPLCPGLAHLTLLLNYLLPQLVHLRLQLSPVLQLTRQSHLQ